MRLTYTSKDGDMVRRVAQLLQWVLLRAYGCGAAVRRTRTSKDCDMVCRAGCPLAALLQYLAVSGFLQHF